MYGRKKYVVYVQKGHRTFRNCHMIYIVGLFKHMHRFIVYYTTYNVQLPQYPNDCMSSYYALYLIVSMNIWSSDCIVHDLIFIGCKEQVNKPSQKDSYRL